MTSRFFTNLEQNTLLNKFQGIFENNKDIKYFDALVGYFRSSGYFAIRPFLDDVPHIRILVGINVDKLISKYHSKGLLFQVDEQQTINEFLAGAKSDIQGSPYSKNIEEGILQFVQDIASNKIEVRAHPTKKLHAKIYIFKPEDYNEHKAGHVITGSSNLTDAGLGNGDKSNYEFNVLLNNYDDVLFASEEFENLWKESIPILPAEIEKMKKETYLNNEPTPFEIYIKFLIEYFGKSVEFDPDSITDLPTGFKKLSYQIDAVNQGYDLLMKHNGFFLADVVGLGKTVVATLIAKKFFFSNGFPSHRSWILIITPPAIRKNWQDTFDQFGMDNYKIITNGSTHKVSNPEKYDLIIVDEAHTFRNDTAQAYTNLQILCKTPTKYRLADSKMANKKIILVSATPLNNRPEDIRNLVYLFQDGRDSTLEMSNLNQFFTRKIEAYKKIKDEQDIAIVQKQVAKIYEEIREKVISPLTIRRTRTDLRNNNDYWKDITNQGIEFPVVHQPEKLFYQLNFFLESLYDNTMKYLSDPVTGLTYNRYRAISFLVQEKKLKYQFADLISSQLAKIMKTLLVKRIDSSFHAFKKSLQRFYEANSAMIKMYENGKIIIAPNLPVTEYIMDEKEDELLDLVLASQITDPTIEICTKEDFLDEFAEGLYKDDIILKKLVEGWNKVTDDPKFDKFLDELRARLFSHEINDQKKLVVFSESAETINYLKERLIKNGFKNILAVTSKNRKLLEAKIRSNFDANIPIQEQNNEFNIIISTEVLAEGINLHRSNIIVNYDTPWNSTRLMQRIGRINRIGSTSKHIYIFNFYPTTQVNNDIELEKKAIMKLQAFHSALGEDSQIYSPDEIVNTFGLFDQQIEEERDERLAFLMELRKFKQQNPAEFRMIKNLPLRSRVGRMLPDKDQGTICFIKNNRRDVFYEILANNLNELSFVEIANIFKTNTQEKAVELHDNHHKHIQLAIEDFNKKLQSEAISKQAVDQTQSPAEKTALAYLDSILKFPFISEVETLKIKTTKQAIKLGKYPPLQREINKFIRATKKKQIALTVILDSVIKIIDRFPIQWEDYEEISPTVTIKTYEEIKPEIIISESFIGK
ncbi:MAG TPA: helicase-related protein [Candidatus Cloacimonadota bacterium]|nr:helicase-related protein [Candidatus Cloacimonadota bacterium]